jgi:putative transposase
MHKHEDIRKATQILGIQADKWGRVFQGRGSVKALPTSGSAGILPAYGNPGVSSAKNSIDSSSPNGSAGVSPANEPAQAKSAKGWYSRDYLPHLDAPGLLQMITCRLADALHAQAIELIKQQTSNDIERQKKIEAWLDAGHGSCHLRDPANAAIIEQTFWHFDGDRYHLLAWCVMPNHFHVLIETLPQHRLAAIIHSWKSYSSRYINKRLGRTGTFWQREYFDRYIRDDQHLAAVIRYIHRNPVQAGLCQKAADWPFGSARFERDRAG